MAIPNGFKSNDEYRQYCRCFSRIEAGDTVEVYNAGGSFYMVPVPSWIELKVIGIKPYAIMVGSDNHFGAFWPIAANGHYLTELHSKVNDINRYPYGYWILTPPNIRIKRVIKSVKPVKDVGEYIGWFPQRVDLPVITNTRNG